MSRSLIRAASIGSEAAFDEDIRRPEDAGALRRPANDDRESIGQMPQFLRSQQLASSFKRCKFRRLDGDFFTRGCPRHDPAARDSLPNEPVVDRQGILDNVGPLGGREFSHLIDEREFGWRENRL